MIVRTKTCNQSLNVLMKAECFPAKKNGTQKITHPNNEIPRQKEAKYCSSWTALK